MRPRSPHRRPGVADRLAWPALTRAPSRPRLYGALLRGPPRDPIDADADADADGLLAALAEEPIRSRADANACGSRRATSACPLPLAAASAIVDLALARPPRRAVQGGR